MKKRLEIEDIPSCGMEFQQNIANAADMIFEIQQDRYRDKIINMLTTAAERLKLCDTGEFRKSRAAIARIIEKAERADKEAESISEELQVSFIEICKENALLDGLKLMTENGVKGLKDTAEALKKQSENRDGAFTSAAELRLHDMELSELVAARSLSLIANMLNENNVISERINSLRTNTFALWRANIAALKAAPDVNNFDAVNNTENTLIEAIKNMRRGAPAGSVTPNV